MRHAWIVRPYPHRKYRVKEFLHMNKVAIGWPCIGDLSSKNDKEAIKKAILSYYSYSSPQSLAQAVGTIYRFQTEIKKDDYVLVPDGRLVYIGIIDSEYMYDSAVDSENEGYPHQRSVKWLYDKKAIIRNKLTGRVYDSLKGQQTVFATYHDDIEEIIRSKKHDFTQQPNFDLKQEYLTRLQRGLLRNVNSNTFEEAVRLLFQDYFPGIRRLATTAGKAGDTDLLAELRGNVTIRIQVKHFYPSQGEIEGWVVDQLSDSMNPGDHGVIVTSGVIGDSARKKAELFTDKTISFIDGEEFVEILFEAIDNMDKDTLAVFGLTREIGFL